MQGFTLIEVGMVLIIFALIIGGLVTPLTMQIELRSRQATKATMDSIKEALIGYALTNGRLPCPDFDGDGVEDVRVAPAPANAWDVDVDTVTPVADEMRRPTLACADTGGANNYEGWLPFTTLGVGRSDDWGDRFTYRVSPEFTDDFQVFTDTNSNDTLDAAESAVTAVRTNTSLSSKGDIQISDRGDDASTGGVETKFLNALIGTAEHSTSNAAAVIISHGKNRLGSTDASSGVANPAAPANSDELLNTTNGLQKIARVPTPFNGNCDDTAEGANFCEYDDMVDWIAPSVLLSRMVAAGKLP